MAGEEAVIRILLDDSGAQAQSAPVTPPTSTSIVSKTVSSAAPAVVPTPSAGGATQQEIEQEQRERQQRLAARRAQAGYTPTSLLPPPAPSDGPATEEEIRREAEERAKRLAARRAQAGYSPADLLPPTPAVVPVASAQAAPSAPTPTTAAAPADTRTALEKQIATYEAMMPQPGSPAALKLEKLKEQLARGQKEPSGAFDPVAIARKRIEREEQRAAVEAEYKKLKPPVAPEPPPPFDPVALAKKRVEAEQRRALVEAEYRKLKPVTAQARSGLDALLDSIESLRGTTFAIGGTFGRFISTTLLITSRIRTLRAQAAAKAQEAAPATVPVAEVAPEAPAAIPVAQPVPNAPMAKPVPRTAPAVNPATVPTGGSATTTAATGGGIGLAAGIGIAGLAIGAVVGAIKGLTDTLNRTADKYAEYNPMIAQAQAQAEIKSIMNDMRRAQESGPEMVKFLKAQSEMQQRWEDIKINLLMEITPILTGIFDGISLLLGIAQKQQFEEVKDPATIILDPERVREVRAGATSQLTPGIDILQ